MSKWCNYAQLLQGTAFTSRMGREGCRRLRARRCVMMTSCWANHKADGWTTKKKKLLRVLEILLALLPSRLCNFALGRGELFPPWIKQSWSFWLEFLLPSLIYLLQFSTNLLTLEAEDSQHNRHLGFFCSKYLPIIPQQAPFFFSLFFKKGWPPYCLTSNIVFNFINE